MQRISPLVRPLVQRFLPSCARNVYFPDHQFRHLLTDWTARRYSSTASERFPSKTALEPSPISVNLSRLYSWSEQGHSSGQNHSKEPLRGDFGLTLGIMIGVTTAYYYLKKEEGLEEPQNLHIDDLDKLAKLFQVKVPNKKEKEWDNNYRQACFDAAYAACQKGSWTLIQKQAKLLEQLKDNWGRTLLQVAIDKEDLSLIRSFIENKFCVFQTDLQGNTALYNAACTGNAKIVKALLAYINPNDGGGLQLTPLQIAAREGYREIIALLLEKGADIAKNLQEAENSAISLTIRHGEIGSLTELLGHWTINGKIQAVLTGSFAIHLCVKYGQLEMLKYLLIDHSAAAKGLLNAKDSTGRTPLHYASEKGHRKIVELLIENGADWSVRDNSGFTAVHAAAIGEQPEIIMVLNYYEADLNAEDFSGKSPISLLAKHTSFDALHCKTLLATLPVIKTAQKVAPPNFNQHPPQNVVYKGGGPNGIALIGALLRAGLEPKRVAGTSEGAIIATLQAVGYTPAELKEILKKHDLTTFLDFTDDSAKAWFETVQTGDLKKTILDYWQSGNAIRAPLSMAKEYYRKLSSTTGLCEGEKFRLWMEEQIFQKTGISHCTFGELHDLIKKDPSQYKELHMFSIQIDQTDLSKVQHFDSENFEWKDLIISDGACGAISIPGVFKPHCLYFKDRSGRRYKREDLGSFINSSLIKNYPLDTFDDEKHQRNPAWGSASNPATLGIKLVSDIPPPFIPKMSTAKEFASAIIRTYWNVEETLEREHGYNEDRTLRIPIKSVNLTDFNLSDSNKEELIQAGCDAADVFFKPR